MNRIRRKKFRYKTLIYTDGFLNIVIRFLTKFNISTEHNVNETLITVNEIKGNSIDEIIKNNSIEEIIKDNSIEEIIKDNSIEEIIKDNSIEEIIKNNSIDEIIKDNSIDEIIKDNSIDEIIKDNSIDEIIKDNSIEEIIKDNSIEEIIKDNSIEEIIKDNSIDEIIKDNSIEEIIKDNSIEEIIKDNSIEEIIKDNSIEEIIKDNSKEEIIKDNSIEEIIKDNSIDEIIKDNSIEEIIKDNSIEDLFTGETLITVGDVVTKTTNDNSIEDLSPNESLITVSNVVNECINQVNGSINDNQIDEIEKQLKSIRQEKHDEYKLLSNDGENTKINDKHKWPKNTLLCVSDSIHNKLDEKCLSKYMNVKVTAFNGVNIEDMYSYVKPLLKKESPHVLLHVGTNEAPFLTSEHIFNEIIEKSVENVKVIISQSILPTDNAKAQMTINNLNSKLSNLNILCMSNSNVKGEHLGRNGLHLKDRGNGRIALNIMNLIRELQPSPETLLVIIMVIRLH